MAEAEGIQGARRASATVRQHRALLEAILDRMGSQVFVKDLDGRYLLANRQIELEAGVAHDEMIGRTDAELFPGSATDVWRANDLAVIAGRVPVAYEEDFEHPDGVQTFLSQKFPLLDAAGEPYALGGVSTNITARKRTEQAVAAANQAKSAFLSRMSHELRTPLNAVMGFAQLLQMDDLTPHQHDAVGEILHGARHLLELINEVLDIARIESGHFAVALGDVVVDDVIDEVARLMRPMAERRRIALDADVAGARGLVVRADRQRLKQVLLNLVSNAVKYTPEAGTVRLRSSTDGERVTVLRGRYRRRHRPPRHRAPVRPVRAPRRRAQRDRRQRARSGVGEEPGRGHARHDRGGVDARRRLGLQRRPVPRPSGAQRRRRPSPRSFGVIGGRARRPSDAQTVRW